MEMAGGVPRGSLASHRLRAGRYSLAPPPAPLFCMRVLMTSGGLQIAHATVAPPPFAVLHCMPYAAWRFGGGGRGGEGNMCAAIAVRCAARHAVSDWLRVAIRAGGRQYRL